MPSTRAILLDMGNVIVAFDFARAWAKLAPLAPGPIDEVRVRLRASGIVRQLDTGRMAPEDFIARFVEVLGAPLTHDEFLTIWSSIFVGQILSDEWLAALARRYPLLLLSNTNAIHFAEVERRFTFLRYFHRRVLSFVAGATKPDAAIYLEAIRAAGCEPGECFFADDMPDFVDGALRQGIDAVRFESAAQLEDALRSRGVAW